MSSTRAYLVGKTLKMSGSFIVRPASGAIPCVEFPLIVTGINNSNNNGAKYNQQPIFINKRYYNRRGIYSSRPFFFPTRFVQDTVYFGGYYPKYVFAMVQCLRVINFWNVRLKFLFGRYQEVQLKFGFVLFLLKKRLQVYRSNPCFYYFQCRFFSKFDSLNVYKSSKVGRSIVFLLYISYFSARK